MDTNLKKASAADATAMANIPTAPAYQPNVVSLIIRNPICGGQCSLLNGAAPDPRLLAFVTADDYAKKLKEVDEMFVAQTSSARLVEQLKRYRRVAALVILAWFIFAVVGAVTSVLFAQSENDWKCAEKEQGQCSLSQDAYEDSCCNFWCCSSEYREGITGAAELFGADEYEHSSWEPYAYIGFQNASKGGLSAQLGEMCYYRKLGKDPPDPLCEPGSFINCGLEDGSAHSCVLYVEGKIVGQATVWWPWIFVGLAYAALHSVLAAFFLDHLCYISRVTQGVPAIFADWHQFGINARFDPGQQSAGSTAMGTAAAEGDRPCCLIFGIVVPRGDEVPRDVEMCVKS